MRTLPSNAAFRPGPGPGGVGGACTWSLSGPPCFDEAIPDTTRIYQVSAGVADARGRAATAGLTVHLHTDARYRSSPSTLKIILLIAYALSLLALLAVGLRAWGGWRR